MLKIHQSGINCLTIVEYNEGKFVITGGDDQRICICKIRDDYTPLILLGGIQAHSTAINGIAAFIQDNSLFILSVGLDRFVCIHRYDFLDPRDDNGFVAIGKAKVDVADAAVLRLISHDSTIVQVFIGGVGYGIYNIPYT